MWRAFLVWAAAIAMGALALGCSTEHDDPEDTLTQTTDTDTSQGGTEEETVTQSESDSLSQTDDFESYCAIGLYAVVEKSAGAGRCLSLPEGLVLQRGESLIIARNATPDQMRGCFPELPQVTDEGFGGGGVLWQGGSLYFLNGGHSMFRLSGGLPSVGPDVTYELHSDSCVGDSGYEGSGDEAVPQGPILDGPTYPVPESMNYPNMTRGLPSAAPDLLSSWQITDGGGVDAMIASPWIGGADGDVPVITEVNDGLESDASCDYIEITCPGGKAMEFCSVVPNLECDFETISTCMHSLYGLAAVSDAAVECARDATTCEEFQNCWSFISFE